MIPIIYDPRYNLKAFGLKRLHPFNGRKYERIHNALIARGVRKAGDFVRPRPLGRDDLAKVHDPGYLRSLRKSEVLAKILEVPVVRRLPAWLLDWRILRAMRYAAGGTASACRLALERGVAVNLGGGFHHAAPGRGHGFCVYADIPIAVRTLWEEGAVSRVLVVDLDAHQGDGVALAFRSWEWARIFDVYEDDLFPFPKEHEEYSTPIPPGLAGREYLDVVREALPWVLDDAKPDLVVYNAGTDPFVGDPLTRSRLTEEDLVDRDLIVVTEARDQGIPVAMVLSGGYSARSWSIHADAIEGLATRFDRDAEAKSRHG